MPKKSNPDPKAASSESSTAPAPASRRSASASRTKTGTTRTAADPAAGTPAAPRRTTRKSSGTNGMAAGADAGFTANLEPAFAQTVISTGSGAGAAVAVAPAPVAAAAAPARRRQPVRTNTVAKATADLSTEPAATTVAAIDPQAFYTEVEQTAYFLAEKRGFQDGDPVADWLEAERIVRARMENHLN